MTTHGLATRETRPTTGLITTTDVFHQKLDQWKRSDCHVLCPAVNFATLPEQHGLLATAVQVNPDPNGGEVYFNKMFCGQGEVAIAKAGLRKIADCAGYSITTHRTDDRSVPFFWEFKATASRIGFDGTREFRESTQEWDLRDGSLRLKGFKPAQVEEARKNGLRNCETRAINSVIRELGIKQKYAQTELAKPFIVIRVMFQPDMRDPEIQRLAAAAHFNGVAQLYPPTTPEPGATRAIDAAVTDDDLSDLPSEETQPATEASSSLLHVTAVLRAGQGFVVKTRETGDRRLETADREVALAAKTAMEAGVAVDLAVEQRDGRWLIVSIEPAQDTEVKL